MATYLENLCIFCSLYIYIIFAYPWKFAIRGGEPPPPSRHRLRTLGHTMRTPHARHRCARTRASASPSRTEKNAPRERAADGEAARERARRTDKRHAHHALGGDARQRAVGVLHTRTHARTHARARARTHARAHARTHTRTRTRAHARTRARSHPGGGGGLCMLLYYIIIIIL